MACQIKYSSLWKSYEDDRLMWLVTTGVTPKSAIIELQAASSCTAASRNEIQTLKIMLEHGADIHQGIILLLICICLLLL